jgi:hypothetical protein
MMAGAVRVAVSARLACSKVLGHFALRVRCRFRVDDRTQSADCAGQEVYQVFRCGGGEDRATGGGEGDFAGLEGLPGAASFPGGARRGRRTCSPTEFSGMAGMKNSVNHRRPARCRCCWSSPQRRQWKGALRDRPVEHAQAKMISTIGALPAKPDTPRARHGQRRHAFSGAGKFIMSWSKPKVRRPVRIRYLLPGPGNPLSPRRWLAKPTCSARSSRPRTATPG